MRQVDALIQEVKNNRKLQNRQPRKWSRSPERWSFTRGSNYRALIGNLGVFGWMVAYMGGGRLRKFDTHGQLYMLWFNFFLGLNFIFLCFKVMIRRGSTPVSRVLRKSVRSVHNKKIYKNI